MISSVVTYDIIQKLLWYHRYDMISYAYDIMYMISSQLTTRQLSIERI